MHQINPRRLAFKAFLLFGLVNLLFAIWRLPVGQASLYNLVFPGRTRFPFGEGVSESNITVDDLDVMFRSHVVSAAKQKDEFRVIILGDSSVWGVFLRADQTLSAQLNADNLTCAGKDLRFYNLGYPHPSVLQDFLILDRALQYKPDMIIWMTTLNSVRQRPLNTFLVDNIDQISALDRRYNMRTEYDGAAPSQDTFLDRTIIGQRSQLARLFLLQSLGAIWSATGLDMNPDMTYQQLSNDLNDSIGLDQDVTQPEDLSPLLMMDYFKNASQLDGDTPTLIVNEPIFIGTGENSQIRYNRMYPRWAYDQYRGLLAKEASVDGWHYLDLWNSIPADKFTDTPLHLNPDGENLLAGILEPSIRQLACP